MNADGMLKTAVGVIAYLLFWILFTASGLWLMLEMRGLIVEGMILAQLNPWAVRGYDRVVIFVLGVGWFIAMFWFEHYLRTGNQQNRLRQNILNVAMVQAILAVCVVGIRFWMER